MAWNPAALGPLAGTHVYAQGAAMRGSGVYQRLDLDRFPERADDEPQTFDQAEYESYSGDWFVGLAHDFASDRVVFAVGAYTPFVERSTPGEWSGQYYRRELTWEHLAGSLALSYRVSGDFYFGVAFTAMRAKLHASLDRDLILEDPQLRPLGYEAPGGRQRLDIRTDGWGFTGAVGLLYRPKRSLDVGIGWFFRHAVQTEGSAEVVDYDGVFQGRARAEYRLPDAVHAGLEWRLRPRVTVSATLLYLSTRLHDDLVLRPLGYEFSRRPRRPDEAVIPESVVIDRGFQDVWGLEAAVSYAPLALLSVGLGAGAETGAVEKERVNPAQVDGPKATGRIFALLRPASWFSIGATWEIAVMRDRDVTDSVYDPDAALRCLDSDYDVEQCDDFSGGRALPDPRGRYELITQRFLVGATFDQW